MTGIRAWLRAQWYRLFRNPEPYASEFADAPDAVDAHADSVPVERAQPWTGGPGSPAIVAGDDLAVGGLIGEIYVAADAYRHGAELGGPRELSPLSRWTEKGWCPSRDWRLSNDKRWS